MCTSPNKGGKYCNVCATPHPKHQVVAAAPAPVVVAASELAPAPSKHPSGIIHDVVGTAGTNHGCSCKEHDCCNEVQQDNVVVRLQHEQILVPDFNTGGGQDEGGDGHHRQMGFGSSELLSGWFPPPCICCAGETLG